MDITLKHRESGTSCVIEVLENSTVRTVKFAANRQLFNGAIDLPFSCLRTVDGTELAQDDQLISGLGLEFGTVLYVESTSVGNRQVHLQSISASPDDPSAYVLLGNMLKDSETISVPEIGRNVTKRQLFQRAISLDKDYHAAYYHLACCNGVDSHDRESLMLSAISRAPQEGAYYRALAGILAKGRTTAVNGQLWGRTALCSRAIALDPFDVESYILLADSGANVMLQGEAHVSTKESLLCRAVLIDPTHAPTYCRLAECLDTPTSTPASDTVTLPRWLYDRLLTLDTSLASRVEVLENSPSNRGVTVAVLALQCSVDECSDDPPPLLTKQDLLLKAISLDCRLTRAYTTLGNMLPWRGRAVLLDHTIMTKQQLLVHAISLEPDSATAYHNLASGILDYTRRRGGGAPPQVEIEGRPWGAVELLEKCIELNPDSADTYALLGEALQGSATAGLPNGVRLGKRSLLLKAMGLRRHARAYSQLGLLLGPTESISIIFGALMSQQQLLQRAITLDPDTGDLYTNLADTLHRHWDTVVLEQTRETLTQLQLYKRAVALDPRNPLPLCRIARAIGSNGRTTLEDGTSVTGAELCKRAIAAEPDMPEALFCLAKGMGEDTTVEIEVFPEDYRVEIGGDGATRPREVAVEQAAPTPVIREGTLQGASAWGESGPDPAATAADSVRAAASRQPRPPPRPTTVLLPLHRRQLLERVIRLDPSHGAAYIELASLALSGSGSYTFQNGLCLSAADILRKAIALSPGTPEPYSLLASGLPPGGVAVLGPGSSATKQELLLKAVRHAPRRVAKHYYELGREMAEGEEVVLPAPDGVSQREQVFKRVVALAPDSALAGAAFRCLAQCAGLTEVVLLLDTAPMSQTQLYTAAISLDADHIAHNNLGALLRPGEVVSLRDKTRVGARDLFLEAIRREPSHARPYCNLAETLAEGEAVQLPCGGEPLDQRALLLEAIRRDPHDAYLYFVLSSLLGPGETATLTLPAEVGEGLAACGVDVSAHPLDTEVGEEALCLAAVLLDPAFDLPYLSLARLLGGRGGGGGASPQVVEVPSLDTVCAAREAAPKLLLPQGEEVAQADLLCGRMTRLLGWGCVEHGMGPGQDAPFASGAAGLDALAVRQYKVDLFVRAARLHSTDAMAFVNLACSLPAGRRVCVGLACCAESDRGSTREDLLRTALHLDPSCAAAYYGLALRTGEVALRDGTVLSKVELLQRALSADPLLCDAHLLLARTLSERQAGDEGHRAQVALCRCAIQADAARTDAWEALVGVMAAGESLAVGTDVVVSKDVMSNRAAWCP